MAEHPHMDVARVAVDHYDRETAAPDPEPEP